MHIFVLFTPEAFSKTKCFELSWEDPSTGPKSLRKFSRVLPPQNVPCEKSPFFGIVARLYELQVGRQVNPSKAKKQKVFHSSTQSAGIARLMGRGGQR